MNITIGRLLSTRSRRAVDMLTLAALWQEFLGGVGKDEKKAVRAFVSANSENALKTKPKVRTTLFV